MRKPVTGRGEWIHGLVSAALLTVFLGIHAAPLARGLLPESTCQCDHSRSGEPCCCKKASRGARQETALWSSLSRCPSNCRCTAGLSFHFTLLLVLDRSGRDDRVAPGGSPALIPIAINLSSCDLAFLYPRPPPLSL